MTYDDNDDSCVPRFKRKWDERHRRSILLDNLMSAAYEDMCTYADMQLQAEMHSEEGKAAQCEQKFNDSQTCLNLLSQRIDARQLHLKGESYVGAPYDEAELDDWLYPTVPSLFKESFTKMRQYAAAAAGAHTVEDKEANRIAWSNQRTFMDFLEGSAPSQLQKQIEIEQQISRREEADLMPDRHEYS